MNLPRQLLDIVVGWISCSLDEGLYFVINTHFQAPNDVVHAYSKTPVVMSFYWDRISADRRRHHYTFMPYLPRTIPGAAEIEKLSSGDALF
jgi:hypothetical protein